MAIQFHGIDLQNPGNNCHAAFGDDATGDFISRVQQSATQRS
jgi:hypothetical protein